MRNNIEGDNSLSDHFEPGEIISGTYKVIDFLGEGGMGLVYKVEHTLMNKIFALKLLRTSQLTDAVWKRFRVEAQAIARLDHPNIVKIYDMSQTEDGRPFYTMDFLSGQSLDDYLQKNGPLSEKEALPLFRQVCSGLAYAHDRGIIHRDIKPGNIMLLGESIENTPVKIVDFGIAKLVNASDANQNLTRPGEVFGSPLYMSPEQCSGDKLDARTDMYSVAVTMFQSLTGKPPLLGKSAIETTMMHQTVKPPSLSAVASGQSFSRGLEDVVSIMLEKKVDDRFASLADVANTLLQIERGGTAAIKRSARTHELTAGNAHAGGDKYLKQNLFSDTEDNIESEQFDTDNSKFSNNEHESSGFARPFYLLIAALVIGLAAGTCWMLQNNSHKTGEPEAAAQSGDTATESVSAVPTSARNIYNSETAEQKNAVDQALERSDQYAIEIGPIDERTNARVKKFLAGKFDYYSKKTSENGVTYLVFDFPTDFSLGLISLHTDESSVERQAQGRVVIRADGVRFEANSITKHYPELLKRFRPDDLKWLRVENLNEYNKNLGPSISHMTKIWQIELYATKMPDSDFKYIPLGYLEGLNIGRTAITSKRLIESKILPQLRSLSVQEMRNVRPILQELTRTNKITVLDICGTDIDSNDISTLLELTRLHTLYLKRTNITDDDLAKLASLKKLKYLNLDGCPKLTPKCLQILSKFDKLEQLTVPLIYSNDDNLKTLRKTLKHLKKFR